MKKQIRTKTISFADEYSEEYDFVMGLDNGSKWICEAIREKKNRQEESKRSDENYKKTVDKICNEIAELKKEVEEVKKSKVAYIQQDNSNLKLIKKEEPKANIKKIAGAIEW